LTSGPRQVYTLGKIVCNIFHVSSFSHHRGSDKGCVRCYPIPLVRSIELHVFPWFGNCLKSRV
jgi:hypothetical protein